MTRRDSEAASGKGMGDDASWIDANLTAPKNEENLHVRFSCYKWTLKI
jgi:hypothetical protein